MKKIDFVDFFFLFSFSFIADILEVLAGFVSATVLPVILNPAGVAISTVVSIGVTLIAKIFNWFGSSWKTLFEILAISPWALLAVPVISFLFSLLVDVGTSFYLFIKGVKGNKIFFQIASSFFEKFPFFNIIPLRTIIVSIIYFSQRKEVSRKRQLKTI